MQHGQVGAGVSDHAQALCSKCIKSSTTPAEGKQQHRARPRKAAAGSAVSRAAARHRGQLPCMEPCLLSQFAEGHKRHVRIL